MEEKPLALIAVGGNALIQKGQGEQQKSSLSHPAQYLVLRLLITGIPPPPWHLPP